MSYRAARQRHLVRLLLVDGAAMALAFALAYSLRLRLPAEGLYLPLAVYLPTALALMTLLYAVFFRQRLYSELPNRPAAAEAFGIAWAVTVATAVFIALAFFFRDLTLSRLLVGLTYFLLIASLILGRALARAGRRAELAGGAGVRRVLLVGAAATDPALAGLYASEVREGSATVATAILDQSRDVPWLLPHAVPASPFTPTQAEEMLLARTFDEVVVDGTEVPAALIFRWGGLAARYGTTLKVVPPGATLAALPLQFDPSSGIPLLEVGRGLMEPAAQLGKRLLDLALLLILVIPGALLIALIALAVAIGSPGASPFFWHTRLGRGGRLMRILKFRTMVSNAEEVLANDPALRARFEEEYKLEDDPRQTPIGRFLRRTSLDELPQLYNILKGEMSFVGPRPIVPPELAKYGPYGDLLLAVPPGLTGMWQVSGRSSVTYEERIQLDMLYIERWSLPLDLKILWLTIPAVLGRKGAG